jgi:hypothetical protein
MHTGFWWENLREGKHLEEPDVDGRTAFKRGEICEGGRGGVGMDWIDLAQDRDTGGLLCLQK